MKYRARWSGEAIEVSGAVRADLCVLGRHLLRRDRLRTNPQRPSRARGLFLLADMRGGGAGRSSQREKEWWLRRAAENSGFPDDGG